MLPAVDPGQNGYERMVYERANIVRQNEQNKQLRFQARMYDSSGCTTARIYDGPSRDSREARYRLPITD
eukprot:6612127-Prymnesium_polylepis.1